MSLAPRGMGVQEAYRLYAEEKLTINRKYQRKLVWSENEKKHLVDSIEKEFPIPLFMLAKKDSNSTAYEIIDGMQRFNALFSFIEHQFTDELGRCFDLEQFNRAKISKDAGIFTEFPPEIPRLSPAECAKFLEYQLAVTIDTEENEERINEIFGRINSNGRQLSPQEQRQAGLVSELSEFVRKLAMELRGDYSPDVLTLNKMPEVSFNTPREKQRYGIDSSDVFWCKHGIISPNDLAKSEDEQVVADLTISLIIGTPLNASREVFDDYFDPTTENFKMINRSLAAYGPEKLAAEIKATISAIRSVFETETFVSFRNCVHETPRNTARTTFYAVFNAFYNLMFKESKFSDDNFKIRQALNDAQKLMKRSAHHSTTEDRLQNIAVITGLIQPSFLKKDVSSLGTSHGLIVDIENSLRRAKYEASRYEFKLGVSELSSPPKLDQAMYEKLGKIACAIANINPGTDGYIYLGVADKESAANRVTELFGIESVKIGEVFFVGLEHDLTVLGLNIEGYVKKLITELEKLPISEPLRTQLVTSMDHAEYQGRPFVRMRIPAQMELINYDGDFLIRKGSETVIMNAAEAVAQTKLFSQTAK